MLDLSVISGPFANQASGFIVAFLAMGTTVGAFIAGRISYRKTLLDNAKAEAISWKGLYDTAKEKNATYEVRIAELTKDGHDKDLKIASLEGKISVIESFMAKALGKEFTTEITKTTVIG